MTHRGETLIKSDLADGVLTLSLGNAPAHALSLAMIEALQTEVEALEARKDVGALVIYGEGRIFCAGHDLKEMQRHRADGDDGAAFATALFEACSRMMITLAECPKPTFAACDGVATAGGLQLLATCDMAFAGPEARFSLPGVNNGGFCTTPSVAVARRIRSNHLFELSYSGAMFDADWALRAGLINRIEVAPLEAARSFARTVASYHRPAVEAGKSMVYAQMEMPLRQAYAAATPLMIAHFMDPHRIAKEKARWS